jgi:hypothetical protein
MVEAHSRNDILKIMSRMLDKLCPFLPVMAWHDDMSGVVGVMVVVLVELRKRLEVVEARQEAEPAVLPLGRSPRRASFLRQQAFIRR